MMRQFWAAKKEQPDALLFFRMGDFYEMFGDDAQVAADELGIALTSRSKEKDLPMAGVPVKSMEGYLIRLVKKGYTVAICEQLQDPSETKGIVDRGIVRVVSPGTLIEDENLDGGQPLFVLSLHIEPPRGRAKSSTDPQDYPVGLAWADLSTGVFRCSTTTVGRFAEELARIQPAEVLFPDLTESDELFELVQQLRQVVQREEMACTQRPPWSFDAPRGRREICEQLKVKTLEAFEIDDCAEMLAAGGGLLDFLRDTQKNALNQIRDLEVHNASAHLVLDRATRRTLEITQSQQDGGREGTLLDVIDRTRTPMGARLLRQWMLEPLVDCRSISGRHDAVGELVAAATVRQDLRSTLQGLGDMERVSAKVAVGRAGARELLSLASALKKVPELRLAMDARRDLHGSVGVGDSSQEASRSPNLAASGGSSKAARNHPAQGKLDELRDRLDPCTELADSIDATLAEDPPLGIKDGGLIRDGFDVGVDELRKLAAGGKQYLAELQLREAERTGISTLKLGFNRVFGYYIEVSRIQSANVPEDYIRKQTLKNAERYITPELKEYEGKVLGAEEKLKALEYQLFAKLRTAAQEQVDSLLGTAQALAELDVYVGLAEVAVQSRFVRPDVADDHSELQIVGGRHPVVEASALEDPFVPNDTLLGGDAEQLAILTGPNMSGKSTYLRQTALIVLLAQMGSFVPAESARIGLVDRVFTRLGGGDDISRGASTFMVEMVETANILRHASSRSLLLLDEVGRGTSTFDGLAIAWAVCEHVHNHISARCLFATHYHQLTDLASSLPRARNLNVAVREWGEEIVFLHRIDEGGTDRSYGIHVGRLAGLPADVLSRATEVLHRLETDEEDLSHRILQEGAAASAAPAAAEKSTQRGQPVSEPQDAADGMVQTSLFQMFAEKGEADLATEVLGLDVLELSPVQAWKLIERIQKGLS
jgi:DNA mismatch repair protein MutS